MTTLIASAGAVNGWNRIDPSEASDDRRSGFGDLLYDLAVDRGIITDGDSKGARRRLGNVHRRDNALGVRLRNAS
jgi:hypothetical protein